MAGQCRQILGLTLCFIGTLGVALACGLPMWREMSFVGANVVTAQTVWDGLWQHCVVQATGQMQCKRHTSPSLTADLQAGRALTLISIICGFLGFMVVLIGGGVVNYSGNDSDSIRYESRDTRKKACILGGVLCALSGILCLISVSWSISITTFSNNDPLVIAALKRNVGSCVYIGLFSSVLLFLSALLISLVCLEKNIPPPPSSDYSRCTYSHNSGTQRTDTGPNPNRMSCDTYPMSFSDSLYNHALHLSGFPSLWTPPVFL